MNFFRPSISFLTLATLGHAATTTEVELLSEGFESPAIPASPGFVVYNTGGTATSVAFENTWTVFTPTSATGAPVYHADSSFFTPATSQVIAFGGGDNGEANSLQIDISGFSGALSGQLVFDHLFLNGTGQGIQVSIVDTANSNTLFQADYYGAGTAVTVPFAAPTGDTVTLSFTQIGDTTGDDSAFDNVVVSAIVPEPATATLGLLALGAGFLRRKRTA